MNTQDALRVRGFFRVQIENEDGTIAGDSGLVENQITNDGFLNLVKLTGAIAGSLVHSHLALGTGAAPASDATSLPGEVVGTTGAVQRATLSASSNGSTRLDMLATFSSSNSFVTQTENISNIGVFGTSAAGTVFGGNTYASSSCATNQNVNATYYWTFA